MSLNRSDPDWRELLDGMLARSTTPEGIIMAARYSPELAKYVRAAAELRGMSLTAFQRRSAMAIATHDLGLDWLEVMASEPRVRSLGLEGKPFSMSPGPGLGFGKWAILEMGDYS